MVSQKYIKMFILLVVITLLGSRFLYAQSFEISLNKNNIVLPRGAVVDLEIYVKLNNVPAISLSIDCGEDLYCYVPSQITYSGTFNLMISTYSHTYLGERIINLRANYSNQYKNLTIRLYVTDYEISSNIYWIEAYIGEQLEIPFCLYLRDEGIINVTLYPVCPAPMECTLDKTWSTNSTNFNLYIKLPEDRCCYQNLYDICVRGISVGGSVRSRCFFISIKGKLDFNISASPNYFEIYQTQKIYSKINIHISGPLEVKLSIENCPPNSTCSLNQTIFNKSGVALLEISTTRDTPPDTYQITIRATDNRSISKNATLTLKVLKFQEQPPEPPKPPTPPTIEDFNISIYPSADITYQGFSVSAYVYVTISGPLRVNLSIENCPPNSICSLNQTVFLTSGVTTLRVNTSSRTPSGTYYITIKAIDNRSISKNATFVLNIIEAATIGDFDITLYPSSDITYQDSTMNAYVYVTISGPLRVNLSIENCPPNSTCSLNQTTFTSSGTAILTISTTKDTPPETYYITIKAIDNRSISKNATLTLKVLRLPEPIIHPPKPPTPPTIEDFNITLSQSYVKMIRNSEKSVEVYLRIVGNINVTLFVENCPPNSTCSLNQTIFNKSGVALLRIFSMAPVGRYNIRLIGRSEKIEKGVNLTLDVVDFELILPEKIDIKVGEEKTFEIVIKRYGILNVEILMFCPEKITCSIIKTYQRDQHLVYLVLVKVPQNISTGEYKIYIKAIAENFEKLYAVKLNIISPEEEIVPTVPTKEQIISPILPRVGGITVSREIDILDVKIVPENLVFEGYKPKKEEIVVTEYYRAVDLEKEVEIVEYKPKIIKINYLNILIIFLVIIICIEILILLKRKLINV